MILDRLRLPLIACAILALLAAMWAGLIRVGWELPSLAPNLPSNHGPLMVSGFLGVLISIERVIALKQPWMFAAPILSAFGIFALLVDAPMPIAPALIILSSMVLIAIYIVIVRRHAALYTVTMLIGACLWFVGNVLWLTDSPIYRSVLWWGGFLVLTIVGERLELGRLLQLAAWTQRAFLGAVLIVIIGLCVALYSTDIGNRIAGAGMLALAIWLTQFDIARRTVKQKGLTRFIALCMLSGYVWLGVSSVLAIAFGGVTGGFEYDAILHTLYLGFVFSMIFGHAPIILPAVINVPVKFQAAFYAHLGLLHASLILRIVGDLARSSILREWGGTLNVLAILVFIFNTARILRGKK